MCKNSIHQVKLLLRLQKAYQPTTKLCQLRVRVSRINPFDSIRYALQPNH
jgi:hypothetical protein